MSKQAINTFPPVFISYFTLYCTVLYRHPAGGADGGAGGAAGGGAQSQVRGGEQPAPPLHCLDQTGGQARLYGVR